MYLQHNGTTSKDVRPYSPSEKSHAMTSVSESKEGILKVKQKYISMAISSGMDCVLHHAGIPRHHWTRSCQRKHHQNKREKPTLDEKLLLLSDLVFVCLPLTVLLLQSPIEMHDEERRRERSSRELSPAVHRPY